MSAPQEGDCIKVFPLATALARAYNCLLLPGLGVTACLSPADSQLTTHDEEKELEFAYCCSFGRGYNTGYTLYMEREREREYILDCPPAMWPCLLCYAKIFHL